MVVEVDTTVLRYYLPPLITVASLYPTYVIFIAKDCLVLSFTITKVQYLLVVNAVPVLKTTGLGLAITKLFPNLESYSTSDKD